MLRQLIALCPPHRIEIQAEVLGNLLQRGPAVKLTSLPADTWCTYEMIAFNNQVTIKIDGKKMEQYEDKKPAPGGLSVQVTLPQTAVQFRSIEVREPLMLPVDVSWVLLGLVGLLSVEWLTRKLLKLA